MNTSCLGVTDNRICWMNTESVVCARGAGARLLRCSGVPAVASVSSVAPVEGGHWSPHCRHLAPRCPARNLRHILALSLAHGKWGCGAGHGVCSYRDTVTSVVVCTSVSCRVGHPGTVGAATSSKSSTLTLPRNFGSGASQSHLHMHMETKYDRKQFEVQFNCCTNNYVDCRFIQMLLNISFSQNTILVYNCLCFYLQRWWI